MSLTENKVNLDDKGVWSISVKAKKPFEVQGEPWMDETSSFYLADVELVDSRKEPRTRRRLARRSSSHVRMLSQNL